MMGLVIIDAASVKKKRTYLLCPFVSIHGGGGELVDVDTALGMLMTVGIVVAGSPLMMRTNVIIWSLAVAFVIAAAGVAG